MSLPFPRTNREHSPVCNRGRCIDWTVDDEPWWPRVTRAPARTALDAFAVVRERPRRDRFYPGVSETRDGPHVFATKRGKNRGQGQGVRATHSIERHVVYRRRAIEACAARNPSEGSRGEFRWLYDGNLTKEPDDFRLLDIPGIGGEACAFAEALIVARPGSAIRLPA